jgi:hypothetical protein
MSSTATSPCAFTTVNDIGPLPACTHWENSGKGSACSHSPFDCTTANWRDNFGSFAAAIITSASCRFRPCTSKPSCTAAAYSSTDPVKAETAGALVAAPSPGAAPSSGKQEISPTTTATSNRPSDRFICPSPSHTSYLQGIADLSLISSAPRRECC